MAMLGAGYQSTLARPSWRASPPLHPTLRAIMATVASADLLELIVPDAAAWQAWLEEHHQAARGVWLVLAKKGTETPTTLTYSQALEEAICFGWIDGQLRRRDAATYYQRFTPRQARSVWSQGNVALVERLIAAGRVRPAGLAQVERARADGRLAAAYAGPARAEVPDDLVAALRGAPAAAARFDALNGINRYAILHRIEAAKRADTRARRVEQFVAMLARGETLY